MDQITKDLRQLENRITRYVFKNFIKPNHATLTYLEFLKSISQSLRNPTPSQKDIIIDTLYDLKLAEEISMNSDTEKEINDEDNIAELLDEQRCNFIYLKKNKMYRCRNKQTEYSDCCYLHEDEKNVLLDSYLQLEKKYQKIKT